MILIIENKIEAEPDDEFEALGQKFVIYKSGIYHRDTGRPWKRNGEFENPRRAKKFFLLSISEASEEKKKEMIKSLQQGRKING